MRYIGNKTRLLDFLGAVLDEHGVRPGRALDAFAGTASVSRFLKRRGFSVTSCDIMTYSYVLQKSYVELDSVPAFRSLAGELDLDAYQALFTNPAERVIAYLDGQLPQRHSLISREFASAGAAANGRRMYFTMANANRIDAVREQIEEWHGSGRIDASERYLLLTALLEAVDSVANTTGVYAAYVKSWQSNALRPLKLKVPELVTGTGLECRALQGDVNQIARGLGRVDLLYLDPPYNSRQYSGYYHIPELIALGWSGGEPLLRGKTGLIPDGDKRSDWSRRGQCVAALEDLLDAVDARCVLMSYNSEGIIPEDAIEDAFRSRGEDGSYRVHERRYARYRSDRDREDRRYKAAAVSERTYFVRLRR